MGSWRWLSLVVIPMLGLVTYGCWAGGDCAVRATCSEDDLDGAMMGDGSMMDTKPDTFIVPDGPLADGTCNGGAEDCANGMDDNCNMLVDCADPVCQGAGYTCADAPPMGFTGPVAYWEGMSTMMAPPACASPYNGMATNLTSGLGAAPAQCGCTCSGPGQEACGNASGQLWDGNGQCTLACSGGIGLPANFCVNIGCLGPGSGYTSASFPKFPAQNGSCSGNPSKTVPPVTWSNVARTCPFNLPSQQGGCGASKLCVTTPGSPFGGPCIVQAGDLACPAAYPTKHLQYGSVNDTRSCTACACTYNPGTCNGSVSFYTQSGCNGFTGNIAIGTACSAVAIGSTASLQSSGNYFVSPLGSCSAGAVSANGTATPSSPMTICCK